jgi:hypothetical protein
MVWLSLGVSSCVVWWWVGEKRRVRKRMCSGFSSAQPEVRPRGESHAEWAHETLCRPVNAPTTSHFTFFTTLRGKVRGCVLFMF